MKPTDPAGAPAVQAPAGPAVLDAGAARATPWVLSTYFAEGLPYSIAHKVASEFFTATGASLPEIGHTSIFGLPWNLKFLWSPLVDVYATARRWLILAEIALALAAFALAFLSDLGVYGLMAAGFLVLAILAATHDIAIDAFYLQALDKQRQTALSGLRVGAYRVALLAGAGLIFIAGETTWRLCFITAGAGIGVLACVHAALLPRPQLAAAQPGAPARRVSLDAFKVFLAQPRVAASLAFIVLYRAGDALMFAMSSPLLKSLGLDTTMRANVAGAGTVASIVGSILGGIIVARRSLGRTIFPIALLQSLAIPLYVALAWFRPSLPGIFALVLLEQLAAGIGTAVLTVFLMRRCSDTHKAAHFAIGSALMSVSATVAGYYSGEIAAAVGFPAFFTIAFAASIPGVILSRRVPTD